MDPQISSPLSSLHTMKRMKWRNEGERYDCTLVSPFTKTKESAVTTLIHHCEGGKRGDGAAVCVDGVGGESGQLQRLHPITPLNKSYQVLFFSYSNRTPMTEALVTLH